MTTRHYSIALVVFLCGLTVVSADEESYQPAVESDSVGDCFLIGNSLTWDTVPSRLDGQVKWHVDCGKSLPYIVEHPEKPCVKSSTLWPDALRNAQYRTLVLQVHYGSTLDEDVKAIASLIELQPNAEVIIHTGWARSAERNTEWEMSGTAIPLSMNHNTGYFDRLLDELRIRFPDRSFKRTFAMDMLQQVAADIQSEIAPWDNVNDLYRDAIHMNVVTGRYLMHNAVRSVLGQPRSSVGFKDLEDDLKRYLDSVLDRVIEQRSSAAK